MVNRKRSISGAAQKFLSFNKDELSNSEIQEKEERVEQVKDAAQEKEEVVKEVNETVTTEKVNTEIKEIQAEPVKEEDTIKEEKSAKTEQLVGYTFKITKNMRKRMNRVIDEMDENGEKISKQDFILQAVEKEIEKYEKKYDL